MSRNPSTASQHLIANQVYLTPMKPKHYLLSLSAFGLFMMIPVTMAVTGGNVLALLVGWFPPLLLGGAWTLALGKGMDFVLEGRRVTVLFSALCSLGIFAFGVLGGALFNFFLNFRLHGPYGLYDEIFSWFVKPVYWLFLFGLPCALVVGLLFHGGWRLLQREGQ